MSWCFTKARRITKRRHSEEAQSILDRLAAYLHDNESEPVELLCGFWKDQQDAITYQELRTLVLEGYVDEVTARLWQQDYSDLVKRRMPQIWGGAMIAGSQSQPFLSSLSDFSFNMQTPGVIRWIQSRGAAMVTVSTQRQKDAIALLLEDKMRNSHTVDELARLIRPCVGLYRQQAAAVSNYYDHMVKNLTEQHPRTRPERIQLKALDKATKYAERLHRQRAMMIAQTEMAFAYNYGADEGIRQAQADFLIGRCEKVWCTSGDDQVCDECKALDGKRIAMEDLFFSDNRVVYDESGLYPPLHPRCACAVQYVEIEPPPFQINEERARQSANAGDTYSDNPVTEFSSSDTMEQGRGVGEVVSFERDMRTTRALKQAEYKDSNLYVSTKAELTPSEIQKLNQRVTSAKSLMGVSETCKIPFIVVADDEFSSTGMIASYNPRLNAVFLSKDLLDDEQCLLTQIECACPENPLSTLVHELYHWEDAEEYRQKFPKRQSVGDEYSQYQRERCETKLKQIGISEEDIRKIGKYAQISYLDNNFEEVYTEYRTWILLKEMSV